MQLDSLKKIQINNLFKYLCLLTFILISACAKNIHMPNYHGSGSLSAAIWYTVYGDEKTEFPLIVHAEWNDSNQADLAFIFLHGIVFAQCSLSNDTLLCKSESSIPNTQKMAEQMALLTSNAINSLQSQMKLNQNHFTDNVKKYEVENKEFLHKERNTEIKLIVNKFSSTI